MFQRVQGFTRGYKGLQGVTRGYKVLQRVTRVTKGYMTGEFIGKIYAASGILFTLTAEGDRVLSQLVMFLTVFLHWMQKMKFSCYQESSVIHG